MQRYEIILTRANKKTDAPEGRTRPREYKINVWLVSFYFNFPKR